MQYKRWNKNRKNTQLPQGSETSQKECSLCVGEGVHLLGFGELFPARVSSIAEKKNISLILWTSNGASRIKGSVLGG